MLKGVLVGYLAGTITFEPPFISFPIAASLYHAGGMLVPSDVHNLMGPLGWRNHFLRVLDLGP